MDLLQLSPPNRYPRTGVLSPCSWPVSGRYSDLAHSIPCITQSFQPHPRIGLDWCLQLNNFLETKKKRRTRQFTSNPNSQTIQDSVITKPGGCLCHARNCPATQIPRSWPSNGHYGQTLATKAWPFRHVLFAEVVCCSIREKKDYFLHNHHVSRPLCGLWGHPAAVNIKPSANPGNPGCSH